MDRPVSLKAFLLVLVLLVFLAGVQNCLMIWELHQMRASLRSIETSTATMREKMEHIQADVEANADSLDYLTEFVEAWSEGY